MHDMLIPWPFYYSNLKITPTAMSNKNKQNSSFIINSIFFFYIYTNLQALLVAVKISEIWMLGVFLCNKIIHKQRDISWHKWSK